MRLSALDGHRPEPHCRAARPPLAALAMWAGIAGSAAVLVLLLVRGWGSDAWGTAAGVLLVVCAVVCASAAAQGRVASREVSRAVARLAAARDEEQHRRAPKRQTTDGR